MTVDKSQFVTAATIRDMLDRVIAKNPDALVITSSGGSYLVFDNVSDELDSDGDALFGVRDYVTGKQVEIVETEDRPYQS